MFDLIFSRVISYKRTIKYALRVSDLCDIYIIESDLSIIFTLKTIKIAFKLARITTITSFLIILLFRCRSKFYSKSALLSPSSIAL